MNEIRLKPCPFCGGEAIQETGERIVWYDETEEFECVHCTNCKCSVEGETTEEAIRFWNTRKPMEKIVERLAEQEDHYQEMNNIFGMAAMEEAIIIVKEVGGING